MTNKEEVENAIETYKRIIETNKIHLQKEEQLLAEINKQLEQQPKEGEWWYWEISDNAKGIIKSNGKTDGIIWDYTERYNLSFGGLLNSHISGDNQIRRLATTSEIEYFMRLHAERLGIKEGVIVDRSNHSALYAKNGNHMALIRNSRLSYNPIKNIFSMGSWVIRNENGNWATVVKEEVKVKSEPTKFEWQPVLKLKKLVKKSVNLQRKIDKLEGQLQAQKVENKRLLDLINEFVNTIKKTV